MENYLLPIFLIVGGLSFCGASLPRWLMIIGGICGITAGVLMLLPFI